MKRMNALRSAWGLLCALMMMTGLAACSNTQGECTYNTDCPQLGYVCNQETHRCEISDDYVEKRDRLCSSAVDCDPVLEYCDESQNPAKCMPKFEDPPDGGPDGGDNTVKPDNPVCSSPDLRCEEPGVTDQGRDRDQDLWGECCDCDDYDPQVNPGRTEVIYNQKDDDCNPETPDADADRDGYNSVIVPGVTACDDRNASVHPGAEEKCDGIDNNCDGTLDPVECTQNDGGPDGSDDGGDLPPDCPDISGTYDILAFCLQIANAEGVEMVQDGCNLNFNLDAIYCTGTIDAAMNLYVECAGLGFPCTAKASLTSSFTVICSQQCSFIFEPVESGVPCDFHSDPDCTSNGQLCGVVSESGSPTTVCVNTNPGGRQPGYYCNPNQDIHCINSLCIDNYCAAVCSDDMHCSQFDGTSCQTILYNDGEGTVGNIQGCAPTNTGETRCSRTADCSVSRVCSYRQEANDVLTVCRPPNGSGGEAGSTCNQNSECRSNLCVCGDMLCDGSTPGQCSDICSNSADCVQSQMCGSIYIDDLSGQGQAVSACVPDPNSCGRNADCPVGMSCQVSVTPEGFDIVTECWYGAGNSVDNTGEPCYNDSNCFSVWCNQANNYCLGVCMSDDDCPTYEADSPPPSCANDDDCTLEQLCVDNECVRPFECHMAVYFMGFDDNGQPVYDTVNLCRQERRICGTEADCRDGEACTLSYNKAATAATYTCFPGWGAGELGDDCYPEGSDACWTGLCLLFNGGGEGNQYCSQACNTPEDCGNTDLWDCQAIRVDIRPGFVSYIPACTLRPQG